MRRPARSTTSPRRPRARCPRSCDRTCSRRSTRSSARCSSSSWPSAPSRTRCSASSSSPTPRSGSSRSGGPSGPWTRLAMVGEARPRVRRDGTEQRDRGRADRAGRRHRARSGRRVVVDGEVVRRRRPGGRRVAADRRVRPGAQAARRRGAVRLVRRGRLRGVRGPPRSGARPTRRSWPRRPSSSPWSTPSCATGINSILRCMTMLMVPAGILQVVMQPAASGGRAARGSAGPVAGHRADGPRGPGAADLGGVRGRGGPAGPQAVPGAGTARDRGPGTGGHGVPGQDRDADRGRHGLRRDPGTARRGRRLRRVRRRPAGRARMSRRCSRRSARPRNGPTPRCRR